MLAWRAIAETVTIAASFPSYVSFMQNRVFTYLSSLIVSPRSVQETFIQSTASYITYIRTYLYTHSRNMVSSASITSIFQSIARALEDIGTW